MNYQHLSFKQVAKVIKKANVYLNTNTAKAMISNERPYDPISFDNLICIILYCDYSELSFDFTLSFRTSHQFQTLK